MTHNDFRMNQDLLWPLRGFLSTACIECEPNDRITNIVFSTDVTEAPEDDNDDKM